MPFGGQQSRKVGISHSFATNRSVRASAALIEPVYQFDPADLATTAVCTGDEYVITGQKTYVPLAADADSFLVYAKENSLTQAFIVPAASAGLRVGERVHLMGVKALDLRQITLDAVHVPLENRLGGRKGIRLSRILTVSRIGLAALAVGQARAAYEYALAYAKERTAFGEPIAYRQSIAFMLANMRIEIEATRLMAQEAAYKFDQGEDATKAAALAKQYADKMVLEVTDSAVQVLGGHGYVRDHPVELWLRNGRGFATWDGLLMA
ncbi:MAG: acyl-CoA dehydrogenase [Caldilineaceae bacterium]